MDQAKIGRFIAGRRKGAGLTQAQLAEKLNVTTRAVSKWEPGRAMPDASVMLGLCAALAISVNALLSGEVVLTEQYGRTADQNLLELAAQKADADRRLLSLEIFIGVLVTLMLLALVCVAAYLPLAGWLRALLIVAGFIPFALGMAFAIRIEQTAGYYECARCGHRYVPTYRSVLWAAHINRTRRMRCPRCNEVSWQKKVLHKDR